MVSISLEVSVREEDFARILRWYSLAFKDKHPSKDDEQCYNLFNLLHADIKRENEEEKDDN